MAAAGRARASETTRLFRIIGGSFALAILLAYASQLRFENGFVRDYDHYVLGVDFVNTWMSGQAAWHDASPAANYDIEHYNRALQQHFGADTRLQQWSYPPTFLLFSAWFGWLPYAPALALFWAAGLLAWGWVLKSEKRDDRLAIAASPAGLIAFISGQAAFFIASLQLLMARWFDTRPLAAGLLLGLLAIKPHLAIAYPFFLIATRRWKTFVAATFSTVAVIGSSMLLWGTDIWHAYFTVGAPLQQEFVLQHPSRTVMALMPTLYMDLRMLGLPYATAIALHGLVALAALAALFHPYCVKGKAPTQILVLATVSMIVSPYLMAYDTLFFAACLVVWLRGTQTPDRAGVVLAIGCFFLPVLHFVLGVQGIAGSALLPVVFLGWLLKQK